MEKSNEENIIDLTSLDCYYPCNSNYNSRERVIVCDEIIDLVDESFEGEENKSSDGSRTDKDKFKAKNDANKTIAKSKDDNRTKIGLCSICWDKLGNNPLASTKCGHVYCLDCLAKSLKCNKRCPTCRCILKGASAYHPLYLELG